MIMEPQAKQHRLPEFRFILPLLFNLVLYRQEAIAQWTQLNRSVPKSFQINKELLFKQRADWL